MWSQRLTGLELLCLTKTDLPYMHMDNTGCQNISMSNQIVYLFLKQEFQRTSHYTHHMNVRRKQLTTEPQNILHIVMQKKPTHSVRHFKHLITYAQQTVTSELHLL